MLRYWSTAVTVDSSHAHTSTMRKR
jgi:hypothetical protein